MKDINTLYEGISKTIYKICHKYLSTANKHGMDFDDLVSLCNIYFMENYESHDESKGGSFNTFMTTVLNRNLGKHFRYLEANKRKFDGEIVRINGKIQTKGGKMAEISEIIPDKNDFLLDIQYKELLEEILKVADLTKNGRTIIQLKVKGYETGEIADILGVIPQCVSNSLARIKRNLKTMKTIENYYSN